MRGLRERFALELRVVVVVVPLLFKDNDADDAEATMLGEANVEDEATAPTIVLKPPPPLSIMLKRLLFKFSVSSSFAVVVAAAAAIVGEEAVAVAAFKVFNFVTVNVERVERVTVAVVTPFFRLRLKCYYIFILDCSDL